MLAAAAGLLMRYSWDTVIRRRLFIPVTAIQLIGRSSTIKQFH